MFSLEKRAGELLHGERGGIVVWAALSMVMFFALCAMGIDAGYLFLMRNQLQATADAAAEAGAAVLWPPGAVAANLNGVTIAGTFYPGASTAAQAYAAKNMPVATNGTVALNGDVQTGNWNLATRTFDTAVTPVNAVRVTTNRTVSHNNAVPAWFSTLLGRTSTDVRAQATAAHAVGTQQLDMVIVQDVSGSFTGPLSGTKVAQAADLSLVNCIFNNTSNQSLSGLLVETGEVTPTGIVPACGTNCLGSRLDHMATNNQTMTDIINGVGSTRLGPCGSGFGMPSCNSGTYLGPGLTTAAALFNNSKPFPSSSVGRGIVLVTDGKNNCGNCSAAALNTLNVNTNLAASRAGAAGYDLYVVFYNTGNDGPSLTYLTNLKDLNVTAARNAGFAGKGQIFNVPTPGQLGAALLGACEPNIPLALVN